MTSNGATDDVIITITLYVIVMVFGLASNLVLTYLLRTREFMKSKYIFTASISVSHIIMCSLGIPLAISYYVTNDVIILIACDVTVGLCVGTTTLSILSTSMRRALAISERFRHANFTYSGKIKNLVFLWIVSLVLAIPYIFDKNVTNLFRIFPPSLSNQLFYHTSNANESVTVDVTLLPNKTSSELNRNQQNIIEMTTIRQNTTNLNLPRDQIFFVYDLVLLFVVLILPVVVSLILHTMTLRGILKRPNQTHWVKEIMITKQHIAVATVFLTCWFPGMITNIISQRIDIPEAVFRVLHPIGVSVILHFPWIYYLLNAHIKREFSLWWQGLTCTGAEEANV